MLTAMSRDKRLVWIDLEMTGLDPETCTIVEIATIVTAEDLSVVAEGPSIVIHHSEETLSTMSAEVLAMHQKNGLIERIRASKTSLLSACEQTVAFLLEHVEPKTSPLCGNSVWKDRQFLDRYMPAIPALLHYRTIDVSTLKELVRRWYPPELKAPQKRETHRALDDIRESIVELAWYRDKVMRPPSP